MLDLELQRHPDVLAENGIVHQPAVNEELAATALLGSQLVGRVATARFDRVVGMWYGKAPGLDRAADAIRHANHIGCPPTGGVLAVVGDDPGAKSSTLPSASETTLAALQLPTLYPADPAEVVELGLHGYAMSRLSGLWVGCKVATSVADGSQSVSLAPPAPHVPVTIDIDGRPYVHTPSATLAGKSTLDLERSLFYARTEIARRYITANNINRIVVGGTADRIGIVSAGKTWLDLRQALLIMGLDDAELARLGIRLIKLGALYPLDREGMRQFTAGLETVIVVEEKGPFIESQIRDLLYADAVRPDVVGKTDGAGHELFAANGELSPDQIADSLIRPLTGHHPIDALDPVAGGKGGAPAARTAPAHGADAVLLLRLPPQPLRQGPRGLPGGRGHRLSRHGRSDEARTSGHVARPDPDGGRGRAVGGHGAVQRREPHLPESGRRHVLPLRQPGRAGGRLFRGQHHLQDPLQLGRGHDRRPGRQRGAAHPRPGAAAAG